MKKLKYLLPAGLVLVGLGVGLTYWALGGEKLAQSQPVVEDGLSLQLSVTDQLYRYGDELVFTSTIRNESDSTRIYTFNTGCTQGELYINDQQTQLAQMCLMAITDVELAPGQTQTYEYPFRLVEEIGGLDDESIIEFDGQLKLPPGTHAAHLEWQGVVSETVSFTVAD